MSTPRSALSADNATVPRVCSAAGTRHLSGVDQPDKGYGDRLCDPKFSLLPDQTMPYPGVQSFVMTHQDIILSSTGIQVGIQVYNP